MGRERRRTDLYGRTRRFLYGLLLLAAAPGAVAVEELAYVGKYRTAQPTVSAAERRSGATVQGLVVLRAGESQPQLALDTITAQVHEPGSEQAPRFQIPAVERKGGFELALADFGAFELSLRLRRGEAGGWLLGGTLGFHQAGADCPVAAVPSVPVPELYGDETRYLSFEAALRQSQLGFKWRA